MDGCSAHIKRLSGTVAILIALGAQIVWCRELKAGEWIRVKPDMKLVALAPELVEQAPAFIREQLTQATACLMFPDDGAKAEAWTQRWLQVA